jgi:hypothetical protein
LEIPIPQEACSQELGNTLIEIARASQVGQEARSFSIKLPWMPIRPLFWELLAFYCHVGPFADRPNRGVATISTLSPFEQRTNTNNNQQQQRVSPTTCNESSLLPIPKRKEKVVCNARLWLPIQTLSKKRFLKVPAKVIYNQETVTMNCALDILNSTLCFYLPNLVHARVSS